MAYQNINFPSQKLVHGFVEENIAPTTIVSNFAKEYRINRFTTEKRRFTFPSRNLRKTDWDAIRGFLVTVKWMQDSFNLIHPTTGATHKVRLDSLPSVEIISLDANNSPIIVRISDITLIEVFNE